MSVLIEDMKMPDKCINCPFMVSRDNDDCILQSEAANGRFETWDDMKAECPLAETQPESKWIPVTERLPEKPNMYTVTDSKGDVVRFVYTATKSSREYWKRCAKAWMPLPDPYQEGE